MPLVPTSLGRRHWDRARFTEEAVKVQRKPTVFAQDAPLSLDPGRQSDSRLAGTCQKPHPNITEQTLCLLSPCHAKKDVLFESRNHQTSSRLKKKKNNELLLYTIVNATTTKKP